MKTCLEQEILTKHELLVLLEIINQSLAVESDVALQSLLLRVRGLVPCENILSGLGRTNAANEYLSAIKIVNANFPEAWLSHYLESDYEKVDPILHSCFRQFTPQVWTETFEKATSKGQKAFISHAREHGLSQGVTLGIRCFQYSAGSLFSFTGFLMEGSIRHIRVLEYLVPHLHTALMRTAFEPPRNTPALSMREIEVLNWMKEGKTNWEISRILNISERTVKFHVQNILSKFQASTRGHAVALAMSQKLIGL